MPKHMIINEKTKIGELLEQFPQLENYLIQLSPVYQKLKNPVLRKTVAKIATLEQVARVSGMPVETLLEKISSFLKITWETMGENHPDAHSSLPEGIEFVATIDARPMLERNEHPLGLAIQTFQQLNNGQGCILVTPFVPAPLIDKMQERGAMVKTIRKDEEEYWNYFWKNIQKENNHE